MMSHKLDVGGAQTPQQNHVSPQSQQQDPHLASTSMFPSSMSLGLSSQQQGQYPPSGAVFQPARGAYSPPKSGETGVSRNLAVRRRSSPESRIASSMRREERNEVIHASEGTSPQAEASGGGGAIGTSSSEGEDDGEEEEDTAVQLLALRNTLDNRTPRPVSGLTLHSLKPQPTGVSPRHMPMKARARAPRDTSSLSIVAGGESGKDGFPAVVVDGPEGVAEGVSIRPAQAPEWQAGTSLFTAVYGSHLSASQHPSSGLHFGSSPTHLSSGNMHSPSQQSAHASQSSSYHRSLEGSRQERMPWHQSHDTQPPSSHHHFVQHQQLQPHMHPHAGLPHHHQALQHHQHQQQQQQQPLHFQHHPNQQPHQQLPFRAQHPHHMQQQQQYQAGFATTIRHAHASYNHESSLQDFSSAGLDGAYVLSATAVPSPAVHFVPPSSVLQSALQLSQHHAGLASDQRHNAYPHLSQKALEIFRHLDAARAGLQTLLEETPVTTLREYARTRQLTDDQLRTLLSLRIEKWKEIWPPDEELALFTRTDIREFVGKHSLSGEAAESFKEYCRRCYNRRQRRKSDLKRKGSTQNPEDHTSP